MDNNVVVATDTLEALRFEQLGDLAAAGLDDQPLLIHGSIARAALMGEALPDVFMRDGQVRDIDVFVSGTMGKAAVETELTASGLNTPCATDAGLCDVLIRDGKDAYASYRNFVMPLRETDVFDEIQDYEIPGTDGLAIRAFSPAGMLAAHLLQRPLYRPDHYRKDRRFVNWLGRNEVKLPAGLSQSIEEFHKAYHAAYPRGELFIVLSEVYRSVLPEGVRKQFRHITHEFMYKHAGRKSPYIEE